MLTHVQWDQLEWEQLNPLLRRQYLTTTKATAARFWLAKGCIVPRHSHPNAQISYIVEGALKFMFLDGERVVTAGGLLYIPPDVLHGAEALQDTLDLDFFTPPRSDWISRCDAYLRQSGPSSGRTV